MNNNFIIGSDFPGGNIIVDDISGCHVKLRQDYRNSSTWWFWWYFMVEGTSGQTLTFEFMDGDVFSSQGPCCNDGSGWVFLGPDVVKNNSFRFKFPQESKRYYFAFTIPYTDVELEKFLLENPEIVSESLAFTQENRKVKMISLISDNHKYNVLLTARHHACEAEASFVLEGIFEFWLQDTSLKRDIDLRAIPFADTDGVYNGDQGKNRTPHDHNRDYGPFIYAMPKTLIENISQWPPTVVALDLHDPYLKEKSIFFVGAEQGQEKIDRFTEILKKQQAGPLCYDGEADIPFGSGWNTSTLSLSNTRYLRDHELADMAVTIEIPYAQAGNTVISPEKLRAFGHDLGRSIKEYILGKC